MLQRKIIFYPAVARRILMPNWSAIEASFLHLTQPQQLGELASSLAHLKSWGSQTPGRLDEKRNPHKSGRTDRNWSEVFRKYKL
ncbi:hypothetical protein [Nostoc sp. NMS4]|uniref:hypothetical protein n=1 Tax=Nostoc sp. NMS4 TaxID=2815390 RepID=UPI0025D6BC46|nr:hypothetical protein [Nostoc sp. NMS4]MBN3926706.1 hypothetical protein [Nostoc sp. NMS4]